MVGISQLTSLNKEARNTTRYLFSPNKIKHVSNSVTVKLICPHFALNFEAWSYRSFLYYTHHVTRYLLLLHDDITDTYSDLIRSLLWYKSPERVAHERDRDLYWLFFMACEFGERDLVLCSSKNKLVGFWQCFNSELHISAPNKTYLWTKNCHQLSSHRNKRNFSELELCQNIK